MQSRPASHDPHAGRRGVSMVVVVVILLITIILVPIAAILQARKSGLEATLKELKQIEGEEGARIDALTATVRAALEPTGLRGSEAVTELPVGRPSEELRKRLEVVLPPVSGAYAGYTQKAREDLAKADEAIAAKRREIAAYPTLQSLALLAVDRAIAARHRTEQLRTRLQITETHAKSRVDAKGPITQKKIDYMGYLSAQITEVNKKIQAVEEAYTARLAQLNETKAKAEQDDADERRAFNTTMMNVRNKINRQQEELEKMKTEEAIRFESYTSHGRVLRPDIVHQIAFISIGSRERVTPGLKFLAARRGARGRFEYKAELEVKKVWPTHAEVAITKTFHEGKPVVDGDLIVNPLFDTRRPVVVAFAGEKEPGRLRPSWDTDEAGRRIKEIGSEVRAGIGPDVDFVIFTVTEKNRQIDLYPEYQRAKMLGIPVAFAGRQEDEADVPGLYEFLGD